MYTSVKDFLTERKEENGFTLKMLGVLTDESLKQKVWAEGRTLGYLAWHITLSIGEMMDKIGLSPDCPPEDAPAPAKASEIYKTYEKASASMMSEVSTKLTDESLKEEISAYGADLEKGDDIIYVERSRNSSPRTADRAHASGGVEGARYFRARKRRVGGVRNAGTRIRGQNSRFVTLNPCFFILLFAFQESIFNGQIVFINLSL